MWTTIHWVESVGLGLMPRPRGGDWLEGELRHLSRQGVHHLVSLLEPSEVWELELREESIQCMSAGVAFVSFPIQDRGVAEDPRAFVALAGKLRQRLDAGERVVVHCRQGIGRASMLGVCVLRALGWGAQDAWDAIARARGREVPDTPAQRAWVDALEM